MANLTSDEADAGRLRVYHGGVDTRKRGSRKAWGWEDRLYDRRGGVSFDEAMVLTWSRGVLWQGAGPAAHGGAKGGAQSASQQTLFQEVLEEVAFAVLSASK